MDSLPIFRRVESYSDAHTLARAYPDCWGYKITEGRREGGMGGGVDGLISVVIFI